MAAQAVLRINEAEEAGREILRKAGEQARQVTSAADKEAGDRARNMVSEAQKAKQVMIDAAKQKAETDSEELLAGGRAERDKLLSPEPVKRRDAINFVIERVVGGNGNH